MSIQFKTLIKLGLVAAFGAFTTSSLAVAQETPEKNKPTKQSPAPAKQPTFLRVHNDANGTPESLQVAIAKYKIASGPYAGATVDLIGAVHVGEKSYYQELNKRFTEYDAMLYELVADESANKPFEREERDGVNPIGALQTGMKDVLQLKFQLDEVDYSPANFVHADMSPSEFGSDMAKRGDGFVSMFARMMGAGLAVQSSKKSSNQQADMLAAMLTKDPIKVRRAMASQFESMEAQMAGIADKNGKSTLLTERNGKAFQVMERELKAGKKNIGVFYGAGHLLDMHARLIRDFQAEQVEVEWLDAWNLKEIKN